MVPNDDKKMTHIYETLPRSDQIVDFMKSNLIHVLREDVRQKVHGKMIYELMNDIQEKGVYRRVHPVSLCSMPSRRYR